MTPAYSEKVMEHFTNPHNVGEIQNADGMGQVGNPVCLVSGTLVQLNNHYLEIEDVQEKEKVLTHEGVYSTIERRSVRDYEGPIYVLKNKLGLVETTPEHLVLAIKKPKQFKYNYTVNKKKLNPEWYHVSELERRDIALYPILKVIIDQDEHCLNIGHDKKDRCRYHLPEKVPVDSDLLLLAGYYLSEGHATTSGTHAHVGFSFHIEEEEFQNDVIRIVEEKFGLKSSLRLKEDYNVACVLVHSANLARELGQTFGKGATNKHIPDFMLFLPPEKQSHLLRGLWRGDGFIDLKRTRPRAGYSTTSKQLAGQIKTLLLRQGIIPSLYREPGSMTETITHQENYRIHVGDLASLQKLCKIMGVEYKPGRAPKEHSWIKDGFLYTPITSIEKRLFQGTVHNFEVSDQHSYATDSFTVHNCGDMMYIYISVKDDIMTDSQVQDVRLRGGHRN